VISHLRDWLAAALLSHHAIDSFGANVNASSLGGPPFRGIGLQLHNPVVDLAPPTHYVNFADESAAHAPRDSLRLITM
jgi:hypothetical protein